MVNFFFDRYCEIIPEFPSFREGLHRPLPVHFRVNGLKIEPGPLVQMLERKGISLKRVTEPNKFLFDAFGVRSPGNLIEYFVGYLHPQASTSRLAAIALSPENDSYLLGMCASPGGKTSYLPSIPAQLIDGMIRSQIPRKKLRYQKEGDIIVL